MAPIPRPAIERFLEKISPEPNSGCWLWAGTVHSNGYGGFNAAGNAVGTVTAHRFSYEHFVGPVPDGLHLDHLCRTRICVNPAHLEPVTCRENALRGKRTSRETNGGGQINTAKTHCPYGHPYSGENLLVYRGNRQCRTCKRRRWHEWNTSRKDR